MTLVAIPPKASSLLQKMCDTPCPNSALMLHPVHCCASVKFHEENWPTDNYVSFLVIRWISSPWWVSVIHVEVLVVKYHPWRYLISSSVRSRLDFIQGWLKASAADGLTSGSIVNNLLTKSTNSPRFLSWRIKNKELERGFSSHPT